MGLWLIQECRRAWQRAGRAFSYDELTAMAQSAAPFTAFVDPDAECFLAPGDMPAESAPIAKKRAKPFPPTRDKSRAWPSKA